jgi:peptide deformylase
MSILRILTYPDRRLRLRARPVTHVDESVRALAADMAETMYAAPGIGLAATQVGTPQRVVVIDVSETRDGLQVFVNPEILAAHGEHCTEEGCLSVPEVTDKVVRAQRIRYAALDLDGKRIEGEAEGLFAVCLQHEIEHLDGVLFIDHLSALKRERLRKRAGKHARETGMRP